MNRAHKPKGFTLVEFLIAIFILGIGILGLAGLQVTAMQGNLGSKNLTTANVLAERKMEGFKNTPFANLVLVTNQADPDNPLNSNGLGAGNAGRIFNRFWTIQSYAGSSNMKRITVTVNWPEGGRTRSTSLDTVISN
jgi:prepilin-type N-terminal cleavage/methylation domain-containing protein